MIKKILLISILMLTLVKCSSDEDCKSEMPVTDPCEASMPIGADYVIEVPFYITDEMFIPQNNPMKEAAVELGRFLFWEKKLSGDQTMSCGTCHAPEVAFSDAQQFSVGIDGAVGTRNSMALVNLVFDDIITWDGAQPTLERQSGEPVENPIEMHDEWDSVVLELAGDSIYPSMFEAAFGTDCITRRRATKSIAQFIRSMVSFNSKYDKFLTGQANLTSLELLGLEIWDDEGGSSDSGALGGADCFHCHGLDNGRMTDNQFHNNGLDSVFTDLGRGGVTGLPQDNGLFKTPTLRNIELTAPYMHDGRFSTLEQVVEHYNSGGVPSATIDVNMEAVGGGLFLTNEKKAALIEFLKTFTDMDFVNNPDFQDPH